VQGGVGRLKSLLRWAPAVALAALIFVLSSLPGSTFPEVHVQFSDKLAHLSVYALLGALLAWPMDRPGRSGARLVMMAGAAAAAYGATDELHQLLTPMRSAEVWDLVADAAGGLLGAAAYVAMPWRRPRA
jgi:VanZ family protein